MIDAHFKGTFERQLSDRIAKWQGQGRISARLRVPPELSWWYWQEFGTGTKWRDPGRTVEGAVGATIAPVSAPVHGADRFPITPHKKYLVFPGTNSFQGKLVFTQVVMHPGAPPTRSVMKTLPEIEEELVQRVRPLLESGALDKPEVLKAAVYEAVDKARELIATNMSNDLGHTRGTHEDDENDGKLGGQFPGDVFRTESEVVNTSE